MFRQMLKSALLELEYTHVTEANDGEAAWTLIDRSIRNGDPYGLIICDWAMPKMTGIELLKKVRGEAWGSSGFPFIMLTGQADKQNIVDAIENKVTQYMLKPFTVLNLKEKLDQACAKAKAEGYECLPF